MIFYSVPFLLLFVCTSVLLHRAKTLRGQHAVILLANVLFYGYWDVRFLALLAAEILVCYYAMLSYEKGKQRFWMVLSSGACLLILGVFKYCNFFLETFRCAFGVEDPITLKLIVPLGISFYTFQMLSYIFDVYRGVIPAERDPVKLAAYLSFFPQITSGPIVKARDFLPQLNSLHRIRKENVYRGLQLFLLGLTKKIVFADRIGAAVDVVFHAPGAYSGISILFAILGYSMQIYCDFSGYSNMAVGIAAIWDFDLGANFNMPYLAKNPSDFWKRWHISLSSWFREYVYIPLGGSRKGRARTYCNLFVTMLLSGIWHGASWTFVVWGALHALGSVVHKLWREKRKKERQYPLAEILGNFLFVSLLWVVFRAENLSVAAAMITGLFRTGGICYVSVYVAVFLVLMLLGHAAACRKNGGEAMEPGLDLECFRDQLILSLWVFLVVMFAYVGDSAFIYTQF